MFNEPDGKLGQNGPDGKEFNEGDEGRRKASVGLRLMLGSEDMLDKIAAVDWRYTY